MNILFDAMGAQVQVQQATGNRLTRWFDSLTSQGHTCTISDYTQPLAGQLAGVDVYVSLTRQLADPTNLPADLCFSYTPGDLGALQSFVTDGKGILAFTNHSAPFGQGPYWPIYEIQLAASFGIQLSFNSIVSTVGNTLSMPPAATAPSALVDGVSTVQAWDSGGIAPGLFGTALIALANWIDTSGLEPPADACFAALYPFGQGNVIVVGHSGIAGDDNSFRPSQGQIGAADNLRFLDNCIAYLGGG